MQQFHLFANERSLKQENLHEAVFDFDCFRIHPVIDSGAFLACRRWQDVAIDESELQQLFEAQGQGVGR